LKKNIYSTHEAVVVDNVDVRFLGYHVDVLLYDRLVAALAKQSSSDNFFWTEFIQERFYT